MITQAIATIAGSIALMASPMMCDNVADEKIDPMTEIIACATYDDDTALRTYYQARDCIADVVHENRFNDSITECEFEDSQNCIWMQIDGFGLTYVDVDGMAYYLKNVSIRNV